MSTMTWKLKKQLRRKVRKVYLSPAFNPTYWANGTVPLFNKKFRNISIDLYKFYNKRVRKTISNRLSSVSIFIEAISSKFKNLSWYTGIKTKNCYETVKVKNMYENSDNLIIGKRKFLKYNIFFKRTVGQYIDIKEKLSKALTNNFLYGYSKIYYEFSVDGETKELYWYSVSTGYDCYLNNYVKMYLTKYRSLSILNKFNLNINSYYCNMKDNIIPHKVNNLTKKSNLVEMQVTKFKKFNNIKIRLDSFQYLNNVPSFFKKNSWILGSFDLCKLSKNNTNLHL